ncbi:MAG: cytochrome c peroxidase [Pseudomonadota bacterium]
MRSIRLNRPEHNKGAPRDKRFSGASAFFAAALAVLIVAPVPALANGEQSRLPAVLGETDFLPFNEKAAELGRLLFYDPILSGNRNISCGTCHHHDLASADALPLGVGEGGEGIGKDRTTGSGNARIDRRVPRNAPALFNLGHKDIRLLFHDGRLSIDDLFGNGFNSPAEEYLPQGLKHIVAAQALFPMTSETEMAGRPEENEIGGARNNRIDYVWPIIAERIRIIPAYVDRFVEAYDDVDRAPDITIVHVANALGDFVISEWRSFDSPFDRHLAGDETALGDAAKAGMELFYGRGGCSDCHSGQLFTDQEFYGLALPQFGPGRTRVFDLMVRDVGRMVETDRLEDAYRFRTPSLRNVAKTGPYGHNGAYADLEGIIRHHLDPQTAFDRWSRDKVALPGDDRLEKVDFAAMQDRRERARVRNAVDIEPIVLDDRDVQHLIAFLNALTGEKSVSGRLGRPDTVPSGLPVD